MIKSKACSISQAIDKVVGNCNASVSIKPKTETTTTTPTPVSKSKSSKPYGTKPWTTIKPTPKTVPKIAANHLSSAKIVSSSKSNAKSVPMNRRLIGGEEDNLDPVMHLNPTITITLMNNNEKKAATKISNDMVGASSIRSSELQVFTESNSV